MGETGSVVNFVPDVNLSEVTWFAHPEVEMMYAYSKDPETEVDAELVGMCRTDWNLGLVHYWMMKVVRACGGEPCPI